MEVMDKMNERELNRWRTVAAHIVAHPQHHDQSTWADAEDLTCGTVCCIAGWVVALERGLNPLQQAFDVADLMDALAPTEAPIMVEASKLLGLNAQQAGWLFYAADTHAVQDLCRVIVQIPLLDTELERLIQNVLMRWPEDPFTSVEREAAIVRGLC